MHIFICYKQNKIIGLNFVNLRLYDVGQQQREGFLLQPLVRRLAVLEGYHLVAGTGQRAFEEAAHRFVIFGEQDSLLGNLGRLGGHGRLSIALAGSV